MTMPSGGGPRFGAHAFVWTEEWSPEAAEKVIRGAAGLDFVEIPLLRPDSMDVSGTRALLDEHGLGCACSLGLPKNAHLSFVLALFEMGCIYATVHPRSLANYIARRQELFVEPLATLVDRRLDLLEAGEIASATS